MKSFRDPGAQRGARMLRRGVAMALLLAVAGVQAKTGDRNQPMNTSQDSVSGFNAPNTITTLTGHVVVTQGSMKATGDTAQIYLDANTQVSRIVMKGKPAHIQQLDDHDKLMIGEAPTLDYDNINGIAILTPNGVVTQQDTGDAHADKLTYNTQTTYFTGEGNVSATYLRQPKPGPAAPATSSSVPPPAAATTAAPTL